jgi:hypothetical protein
VLAGNVLTARLNVLFRLRQMTLEHLPIHRNTVRATGRIAVPRRLATGHRKPAGRLTPRITREMPAPVRRRSALERVFEQIMIGTSSPAAKFTFH